MAYTREELVKKLNIEHVDTAAQDILLDNLASTVSSRLIAKVSEKLSDEDLDQLSDLIDKGDDNAVEWFIKSKFEHYDKFVEEVEKEVIDQTAHNIKDMTAVYNGDKKPSSLLNL